MSGDVEPAAIPIVAQRAIIVASSTAEFDSRTHRLAATLAGRGHTVTVLARADGGLADERQPDGVVIRRAEFGAADALPLPEIVRRALRDPDGRRSARLGRWSPGILARLARASRVALTSRAQARTFAAMAPSADIVHAMAYLSLPTAHAVAARVGSPPVVYDARDLYADASNVARLPSFVRRAFARSERRLARRAARVVTVNDAYADVLARRLGPPRPLVVMNGPSQREAPGAQECRFHERLGLAPGTSVVLYHGGFSPDRGIEQLIDALPLLPTTTTLVLMGYGRLARALEARAADPGLQGRLRVVPAVAPGELLDWVASADVAAMPIQPSTLNHRLTTPNKLFEAMAAGVPVVAADLPGMTPIVLEAGCGVLCDPTDPASIAAAIRTVLDASDGQRAAWRDGGRAAVAGRYSWESQVGPLLVEYGRLTGRPW